MAGFSSMDDFINKTTTLGQTFRADWNKQFLPTTAAVAGEWFSFFRSAGNPAADSVLNTGTALLFQPLADSTTNATGIPHNGNVSPAYKHIINMSGFTAAATTAPGILMLVDLLGFYRVTAVTTTTAQTTTNTLAALSTFTTDGSSNVCVHTNINILNLSRVQVSNSGGGLPTGLSAATNYFTIKISDTSFKLATSYANAVAGTAITISSAGTGTQSVNGLLTRYTNGTGVQAFFVNSNATPMGAGTPNLSLSSYTNAKGTAAQATPTVLPVGKTAGANGLILYSGTGVGKYGPSVPLAAGDSGILSVETITNSTSYVTGEYSVVLYKQLAVLPITTLGVASERDLMNQVPSLPRIYDGACLVWLYYNGAATPINSAFAGHIDFAWG